jgi:hypothetical protein
MFLLSRSLTLHFPIYDPSFKWITHFQLEMMCYGMCCSLEKIEFSLYKVILRTALHSNYYILLYSYINIGDGYCIIYTSQIITNLVLTLLI